MRVSKSRGVVVSSEAVLRSDCELSPVLDVSEVEVSSLLPATCEVVGNLSWLSCLLSFSLIKVNEVSKTLVISMTIHFIL